ncbi:MAG TPA: universal stress protein [Verrucomicrobiota bacterium]|nr:universal stress protein [Verrucomicrobiota bacterium]HNU51319.1 universal stress protein [Verrucomicrobiota bacterium]
MEGAGIHRPRNVDWKRAAGLLYGDWGTSKAYVIGLAFFYAAYASMPIIIAVCALTALVGYNYILVCRHFPDGGGVYSAARDQSRFLAAVGALLLVANFLVTAALSCNSAMHYFGVPGRQIALFTMGGIIAIGAVNYYGPKHTGSLAMTLAVPMVVVVMLIIAMSVPWLTTARLEPSHDSLKLTWQHFVGVILALSGVEAIANLTGVMKLDPGSTMEKPRVARTARKAILPVALEVVLGTILLGWAMLSLPEANGPDPAAQRDYMMRYLGEQYGMLTFNSVAVGKVLGLVVGVVVGLLLLSAVNTAVAAQIGLVYMLARDGELPRVFTRLNAHGVPWWPWILATCLPVVTVAVTGADLEALARLYAIGVVGAITVNLGSCTFNRKLALRWHERGIMGLTFLILMAVELTIARVNDGALFFAICVLGIGLGLRGYTQRRAGFRTITVREHLAARVSPDAAPDFRLHLEPGQTILVAARGVTPVLRYAMEEARLRQAVLYVLYVKELAVALPVPLHTAAPVRWQDDPQASDIMTSMLKLAEQHGVQVVPIFTVSDNPALTILDLAATLGIDILMLGSPQRHRLVALLKGNVVTAVARNLPENIQLVIHG